MGGRGWAGWSGVRGGKWDNCNSIINKYFFLKRNDVKNEGGDRFSPLAGCGILPGGHVSIKWDTFRGKQEDSETTQSCVENSQKPYLA